MKAQLLLGALLGLGSAFIYYEFLPRLYELLNLSLPPGLYLFMRYGMTLLIFAAGLVSPPMLMKPRVVVSPKVVMLSPDAPIVLPPPPPRRNNKRYGDPLAALPRLEEEPKEADGGLSEEELTLATAFAMGELTHLRHDTYMTFDDAQNIIVNNALLDVQRPNTRTTAQYMDSWMRYYWAIIAPPGRPGLRFLNLKWIVIGLVFLSMAAIFYSNPQLTNALSYLIYNYGFYISIALLLAMAALLYILLRARRR